LTHRPALTYRTAGVNVAAGEDFVHKISNALRSTHAAHPGRILGEGADFAGLFRLGNDFRDPVLVSGTDGVGTKLKVAQQLGRHDTVGIDLVAMCVNDVLTTGAMPLFFLDYIAAGKLEVEAMAAVVEGVAEGCRRAGCALLGGETAEMPDFYEPGAYDLAGFAVGAVEREGLLGAGRVREGDLLLGLPSSGVHSNGYSLVRRIFTEEELKNTAPHPDLGKPLGEILLEPTKIYASAANALRGKPEVHAIAHITGGGLPGNARRVLPPGLQARFRPGSWPEPKIFDLIARQGPVERAEMFRTFNMGMGLVAVIDPAGIGAAESALSDAGETSFRVGEVVKQNGREPAVVIDGVAL
jgi:phosphoribosylformylglycinamidine cyclo-ligase